MSKKFTEYQKFNLSAVGKEVQAEWEKNDVFKKSIEKSGFHARFYR